MNPTSFHSNQCMNLHRVASIRNMKDQVYIDHIYTGHRFRFISFLEPGQIYTNWKKEKNKIVICIKCEVNKHLANLFV